MDEHDVDPIRAAREEIDRPGVTRPNPTGEQSGDVLGRYKLLQQVGEGGFGTVWMAEQLEPVTRRVALKLIRRGMDSKEVLARFESERQALAILDHPRIAKVFDAGVTEGGRPYFVMEYVPGVPITDYCDLRSLGLRERLELFQQACDAIEHAHRKGILHRDIKPSNLLVAAVNGKPTLKVIDFGVAKATSQRLTERTLFTQHGILVGTPGYMSPEQAGIAPLEVDARTDVYSLGVLLYELLAGALPFDPTMLRNVALLELLRIIREEDPPTPGARVASLGARAQEIARHRHLDVRALARQLRGELEWITMRALEKDPGRRYTTAADFARDVGRYLAHEPVDAGPPTLAYRLQKLAQRHRVAIVGAAALAVVSLGFGALLIVQSKRFGRELQESARAAAEMAHPARRLIVPEAGDYNVPQPDGRHLLRYDPERAGFVLVDIESGRIELLTSEGPDPSRSLALDQLLSPDSRRIAAVLWVGAEAGKPSRENDGGRELRVFETGGTGAGQLLHSWGADHFVQVFAWSPDQERIWLFVIRPDRSAEIVSADAVDGSVQVLRTLAWRTHTQEPSLSPDGRFVAFHDTDERDASSDIFFVATDGSGEVRVRNPADDTRPVFTPDGAGVVFVSKRRSGFKDLWYLPVADGRPAGEPRLVWADLGLFGTAKQFGHNGSLYYFFATNAWDVFTLALDDEGRIAGEPEKIEAPGAESNTAPAFSPDGTSLAYERSDGRLVVRDLESGREREYSVRGLGDFLDWREDGAEILSTPVHRNGFAALRIDLVHGGAEAAALKNSWMAQYVSRNEVALLRAEEPGGSEIQRVVRMDLETGAQRVLREGSSELDLLSVSPDGSLLSFVEKDQVEGRLLVMPSTGGEARTLATSVLHLFAATNFTEFDGIMWAPDGKSLLVVRSVRGVGEPSPEVDLWRYPVDGSEAVHLGSFHLPEYETAYLGAFLYRVSPDGTRIAFQRHAGFLAQIWAIDRLQPFIQSGESPPLAALQR